MRSGMEPALGCLQSSLGEDQSISSTQYKAVVDEMWIDEEERKHERCSTMCLEVAELTSLTELKGSFREVVGGKNWT